VNTDEQMPLFAIEPEPGLQHLAIDREPDVEGERRRGIPPPRPPQVVGRAGHGGQVSGEVQGALTQIQATRATHGIAPDRLLVLGFRSWDSGVREVLEERLGATVVDERVETRNVQRRLVQLPASQTIETFSGLLGGHLAQADQEREQLRICRATKEDVEKAGQSQPQLANANVEQLAVLEHTTWPASVEAALRAAFVQELATLPKKKEMVSRVLVQFPAKENLDTFRQELERYTQGDNGPGVIPLGTRQQFFDSLEWSGARTREDRVGPRLKREGLPATPSFFLDVDIWHSQEQSVATTINEIRGLCSKHNGKYVDDLRTQSLILARIEANRPLAEALLDLDLVAQVNLPPVLSSAYSEIFAPSEGLQAPVAPTGSEPRVGVIDSGTLSGHPLLKGWVLAEVDFGTGEGTVTDQHGHGTQVAGLVVYGDVHDCLEKGAWTPRVLVASGKVLMRGPDGRTVFPPGHRPEKLVEDAIRHLHTNHRCRIFNLSLGNPDDVYAGGRQFGWAEVLDHLARELDVVIVISAGNFDEPPLPGGPLSGRDALQEAVRDTLLNEKAARICSPGTAGIAITVGALARSDAPHTGGAVAAAPKHAPAPFSRVGPGYEAKDSQRAVKPELVAYGGNYGLRSVAGGPLSWLRTDRDLGEPTTGLPGGTGRYLTSATGTSFAAPHVAHAAALALDTASVSLGTQASANTVRALLGACADLPPSPREWLQDPDGKETWEKLRLVGYGAVDTTLVEGSRRYSSVLLAEDAVDEDKWHVYSVKVPPSFLGGNGRRGLVVSLAYDPPVRASRRDYLARTMSLEVLRGISANNIAAFRGRQEPGSQAPTLPDTNLLALRPTRGEVVWSTLQVRRFEWSQAPRNLTLLEGETEPTLHILVGCQRRFLHGEAGEQWYGLAVRLWHEDATVDLHQQLRSRIRPRATLRARIKQRG
jgi:subtilisin family serine protease